MTRYSERGRAVSVADSCRQQPFRSTTGRPVPPAAGRKPVCARARPHGTHAVRVTGLRRHQRHGEPRRLFAPYRGAWRSRARPSLPECPPACSSVSSARRAGDARLAGGSWKRRSARARRPRIRNQARRAVVVVDEEGFSTDRTLQSAEEQPVHIEGRFPGASPSPGSSRSRSPAIRGGRRVGRWPGRGGPRWRETKHPSLLESST